MVPILLFLLVLLIPSQLAFHFWPTWVYILGTRIDYLSPTLYLTDLIIFSLILLIRPKIKIPLILLVFIVLNVFFSLSPLVTIYKWLRVLEYCLLFLSLYKIPDTKYIIQKALPWAIIWTSVLAWTQFIKQESIGGLWYWLGERTFNVSTPTIAKFFLFGHELLRPYATFPHPNALAGFLLVSALILIYLYTSPNPSPIIGEGTKGRGIVNIGIILALLTIPLTFSRTAIFLEAILLIYYFLPKFKKTLIGLVIIIGLLITNNQQLTTSFTDRLWLLQKSFLAITTHPLLGLGLGAFPAFQPSLTPPNFSLQFQPVHNIFLLLISELGLPFSLLIIYKLYKFIIHNSKFIIPITIILLTGLFDHYWLTLHQNILLLVLLFSLNEKYSNP